MANILECFLGILDAQRLDNLDAPYRGQALE